ncbi:TraC family protein, partial [Escherichia coli]|uniref:TraC family protein n=2 Tax=Escherichia coli TaxID=562 RepID=UPI0024ACEF0A
MNNPLEAVTQAVNSLVTALKLPDESAKANEVLGEMSFPQFSRLLPYRDYNQESGLFMNDTTMGGTVAKLAMRQPFVLFKGLTFQKLCLPGAFRPG